MSSHLPNNLPGNARVMIFVDGENLAIRYKRTLENGEPQSHVNFEPDIFVWSRYMNLDHRMQVWRVVRKYYYTSARQDDLYRQDIEEKLKGLGIEAPRVFKKDKTRGSKRVDISLAVDMLTHAHRKNYDVAILVAGDEDYVPLVQAVMAEGRQVVLWFLKNGLSPVLKREVDFYFDISEFLFNDEDYLEEYFST